MSAAAAGTHRTARINAASFTIVPPLLVLAALFFYPFALIAIQSVTSAAGAFDPASFFRVLRTTVFQRALVNTVEIAVSATAGCLLLGFATALILTFVPFPGARLVSRLIDLFIALPTFLIALALTFIYGSAGILNLSLMQVFGAAEPPVDFLYSMTGVILAEITVYTPFILRPLLAAFSLIETAQIEVASSLGARAGRIVRHIILPAALPALLAGGSLCLLLTVNEFGIVFFIGAKGATTLPLLIYEKAIQDDDYTAACAIAVINVVLSLSLYRLYMTLVRRAGARRG